MNNKEQKSRYRLGGGFIPYIIVLIASFISTQALRSPISAILFTFVFLIGIISFICVMIGAASIQVYVSSDRARIEKDSPLGYEIRVINPTPIPFPFVEVFITQPREDGIKCAKRKTYLSIASFDGYIINKTVSFRYRGLYEIGVSHFYISDFLRTVRIRVDVDNYSNVLVYPRILDVKAKDNEAYNELPSFAAPIATNEIAEAANIREYRIGDSQKSVHWKLSSKSEELQVRDYSINRDRNIYIFADLSAPTPCPEAEKPKVDKKLKKALTIKEKNKVKLSEKAFAVAGDKAEKVTEKLKGFLSIFKKRKRKAKNNTNETVMMIDNLINETYKKAKREANADINSKKEKKAAEKKLKKAEILERRSENQQLEENLIEQLYNEISEIVDDNKAYADNIINWGGKLKDEYEDDMAEFVCDGVVEITLSAIRRELNRGNKCTLIWFDSRDDRGFSLKEISSHGELEEAFESFSAAKTVSHTKHVTELIELISQSMNVTIKIATANIDPISVGEYSLVPASFGGAGSGCTCEIMLFNPDSRYTNPHARREYAESVKAQLLSQGIITTEFKYLKAENLPSTLISVDF